MGKLIKNFWFQLVLAIVISAIGAFAFSVLSLMYKIKYSGIIIFDLGSSGDNSPITLTISIAFAILIFAFPVFIWLILQKKNPHLRAKPKIITFLLFATLPLWAYLLVGFFQKLTSGYKNYVSVRKLCINKNGVNQKLEGNYRREFECKNGVLNGFNKKYNSQGVLIYEANYSNGKLEGTEKSFYEEGLLHISTEYKKGARDGTEIYYDEDGNTTLYVVNSPDKSNHVYYQIPEDHIDTSLSVGSQKTICNSERKEIYKYYDFSCNGDVFDGIFVKRDTDGNELLRANLSNGALDGIYETYEGEGVHSHLEFTNGRLNGDVYLNYDEARTQYEGQYLNGSQQGVFRMYNHKGDIESEVEFKRGQIVRVVTF